MIKHAVLFSFKYEVGVEARATLLADIALLPDQFPQMRRFALGANTSRRDQTFQHMMVIDFESRADLDAYLDSDLHETFVKTRFAPLVSDRAIATIEQN